MAREHLRELERLADTAGARVVGELTQQLDKPDPATYIGSGKLDELKANLRVGGRGQTVTVSFDTVRKNLPELLAIVRDVLRSPTFPASEFDLLWC